MQPSADEFTEKGWESIIEAQKNAQERKHQQIETGHLLFSLSNSNQLTERIFSRLNSSSKVIKEIVDVHLKSLPKMATTQQSLFLSQDLITTLTEARRIKDTFDDQFISTEHLMIAISKDLKACKEILLKEKISEETLLKVIQEIRGNQKVTDQTPETKYESLYKYGVNLTEAAKEGK